MACFGLMLGGAIGAVVGCLLFWWLARAMTKPSRGARGASDRGSESVAKSPVCRQRPSASNYVQCATCDAPMETTSCVGVSITQCSRCEGIWLNTAVIGELLKRSPLRASVDQVFGALAANRPMPTGLPCPDCGQSLLASRYRKTEVDHCSNCKAIYLDKGELEQLARLYVREKKRPAGKKSSRESSNGWSTSHDTDPAEELFDVGDFLWVVFEVVFRIV